MGEDEVGPREEDRGMHHLQREAPAMSQSAYPSMTAPSRGAFWAEETAARASRSEDIPAAAASA